jgi:type IV pilus assembly protein PilP
VEVVSVQEEVEYRYDARSRRDPFRSVLDLAKSKERLAELPPLQRVEIIDMKVTAIVWGTLGPTALIKTPDGKGYTVRPGTLVGPNKGVIERISESAIMIREQSVDIFGVKKTRQIELELHPQEEGKE